MEILKLLFIFSIFLPTQATLKLSRTVNASSLSYVLLVFLVLAALVICGLANAISTIQVQKKPGKSENNDEKT